MSAPQAIYYQRPPRPPKSARLSARAARIKRMEDAGLGVGRNNNVYMSGGGTYKSKRRTTRRFSKRYGGRRLRGKGFYKGFLEDAGGLVGGAFGYRGMGRAAGNWLSGVTGFGDYTVAGNTLMPDMPQIENPSEEGAVTIRHKEFIKDIYPTSAFTTQVDVTINPGLVSSFPWLSTIAQNFGQYRVEGMIFYYKTTSGESMNSSNTSLGEIVMATQYDVVQQEFENKQQMLTQQFSTSFKPSSNGIHPIECMPSQTTINQLFVRAGAVPTGADKRLYDLGRTTLATQGCPNGGATGDDLTPIGELWVDYQVSFFKPQLGGGPSGTGGGGVTLPTTVLEFPDGNISTTEWRTSDTPVRPIDDLGVTTSSAGLTWDVPSGSTVKSWWVIFQTNFANGSWDEAPSPGTYTPVFNITDPYGIMEYNNFPLTGTYPSYCKGGFSFRYKPPPAGTPTLNIAAISAGIGGAGNGANLGSVGYRVIITPCSDAL